MPISIIFQIVEIFFVQCAAVPGNAVIALAKIATVLECPAALASVSLSVPSKMGALCSDLQFPQLVIFHQHLFLIKPVALSHTRKNPRILTPIKIAISPERNIPHCLFLLLILFTLEDTRRFHRTESECHEHCCTHAQEPVCHGIVSGLRQVNFYVGRICTSAGLRVYGINIQHIAVFVGQRNFASFLRACGDFCICWCDTGFLLVIVDCPAAKIFIRNVGHTRGCAVVIVVADVAEVDSVLEALVVV